MSSSNQANLESFLSIINTVVDNNEGPIPSHLAPLLEGSNLPKPDDLDKAIEDAGNTLTDEQCACLFTNIVNVSFKEGRVQDRSLLRNAEKSLRIDSSDAREVIDGIEKQFQIDQVFTEDEDWGLFCAGLIAIGHADGNLAPSEEAYIERLTSESKHLEAGKKINSEKTAEELGESLADFSTRQRRCLAAHSINMMFVDGEWTDSEQEYFELASKRMRLSRFEEDRLMKGLWTLHNLSVFT